MEKIKIIKIKNLINTNYTQNILKLNKNTKIEINYLKEYINTEIIEINKTKTRRELESYSNLDKINCIN